MKIPVFFYSIHDAKATAIAELLYTGAKRSSADSGYPFWPKFFQ